MTEITGDIGPDPHNHKLEPRTTSIINPQNQHNHLTPSPRPPNEPLAPPPARPPLLKLIQDGKIDPWFVITDRLALSDAAGGYSTFKTNKDDCIKNRDET